MITIFEKVIREKLAHELKPADFPLSFLKFSTVGSGAGLNDKVIFLVFKNEASEPFLCLKTVRNAGAAHAIVRNFENLQKLNAVTQGSPYAQIFAKAIALYNTPDVIFSIETACPGKRIGRDQTKLAKAIETYIDFQVFLAKQGGGLQTLEEIAKETISKAKISPSDQQKILAYFNSLPAGDIRLPRILQHGDMTLDNVLLSSDGLHIVDYDDTGNINVPGFDPFSLFRRFSWTECRRLCDQYFPHYFQKIGGVFDNSKYRGLIFLYNFIEYTQKKGHNFEPVSADDVINGFERLYPQA